MGTVTIRDLDDEVIARAKERAQRHNRSLEAELRLALTREFKPLSPEELQAAGLVQFPSAIGGVVPVVNIDGLAPGALKLTGPLLADIFLGKVTTWNAPEIAGLNPGLALPDGKISIVELSRFAADAA